MNNFDDFQIEDDIAVDENYPEQDLTPAPPAPGSYTFKVGKWAPRTNKDGSPVLWKNAAGDPTYPLITIQSAEITDPQENARKFVPFQDISTVPFEREGKRVSKAADLLRSYDAGAQASNTGEILRALADKMNSGLEFRGRLDYTGYDATFANDQIAKAGGKSALDKKTLNEIYAKAKIRGARQIKKANTAAGKPNLPLHKWVGPSGNIIPVKAEIMTFYASTDESVKLGAETIA